MATAATVIEPKGLAAFGGQDREIVEGLLAVHEEVRSAILAGPPARKSKTATNPKGDQQEWFDLIADDVVLRVLEEHFGSGEIVSEERAKPKRFGTGDARLKFVVDPVDGSKNFARGVPLCGVAVAVMRADAHLATQSVTHAMVGGLVEGDAPMYAVRGGGSYRVLPTGEHERLRTTKAKDIEGVYLSLEMKPSAVSRGEQVISDLASTHRIFGASTRAIAMIAEKRVDLHLDVRGRLTPENFLAPILLVTEAGGYACTSDGKAVGPFKTLTDGASIVVAASKQLALRAVEILGDPDAA